MGWDKRDKGKLQVKGKQNRDHTGAMANLVRVLLPVTEYGPHDLFRSCEMLQAEHVHQIPDYVHHDTV